MDMLSPAGNACVTQEASQSLLTNATPTALTGAHEPSAIAHWALVFQITQETPVFINRESLLEVVPRRQAELNHSLWS